MCGGAEVAGYVRSPYLVGLLLGEAMNLVPVRATPP